jgi:vancomycin resistance protein YoaR
VPSLSLASRQVRILLVAAAALGVLGAVYLYAALSSGGTARPGTVVGGVDISGMTPEEAASAVASQTASQVDRPLRVRADGLNFRITPSDAGLTVDAEASVASAFGRVWNPIGLLASADIQLPLVPAVDETALTNEVTQIADAIARPPVEPRITMRNGIARVKQGEPGQALDAEQMTADLQEAFLLPRKPLKAPIEVVPTVISPEATEQAVALARQATSAPVIVQAGPVQATLTGEEIGQALSFTAQGGALVPQLNGAALHRAISDELAAIETLGRDATFRIRKGVPQVVSSRLGRGVEDDELATAVAGVIGKPEGQRTTLVSVGLREPRLTTADAAQLGIKEKISSFTQKYPYAAYRSQNIGQAAERINGTLLLPGETFSLNDTILERTVENGYTTGYVVGEGGVFREDLGGGVSASATTTWTAAFYAGMERVQTIAHSIWISRYEPGLEATVAWGVFDLKFRNDSPTAVFITASTTPTSMTVSFWGTRQYDRIEAESGPRTEIVPYSKVYNEARDCEPQSGIDGFTITVDRVFYQDDVEVRREPITTRYKPAPQVICDKKPKKENGRPGQNNDFGPGVDVGVPTDAPTGGSTDAPTDGPAPTDDPRPSQEPGEKPTEKPTTKPSDDADVFSN